LKTDGATGAAGTNGTDGAKQVLLEAGPAEEETNGNQRSNELTELMSTAVVSQSGGCKPMAQLVLLEQTNQTKPRRLRQQVLLRPQGIAKPTEQNGTNGTDAERRC
jgi:hypothetical protein